MPEPLHPHETVFAIDPGNAFTAYVLLRGDKKILAFGKEENDLFRERLVGLVALTQPPTVIACETVASYGMPVGASVFETCFFIGVCHGICWHCNWVQVVRLEVKLALCKSPKANDANIRARLIDLYGPPGTKKAPGATYGITADVWAALALAETVRSGDYRPYVPSNERK